MQAKNLILFGCADQADGARSAFHLFVRTKAFLLVLATLSRVLVADRKSS